MAKPTLLKQTSAKVAEIDLGERLRPISEAGVQSLIASIEECGVMKDALHLRKRKAGQLVLIAGGHRLEAARRLGWDEVEVKIWSNVTDDWARLMEIDDNLAGAEMNPLDTAVFLAERKRLYEKLHPETRRGGDRRSAGFQTDIMSVSSFAQATAEKFGMTDRHVRRMIAAGGCLAGDEVARLRAAPQAVSLADLQVIGKLGPADRYDVVAALTEGKAKTAKKALDAVKSERGLQAPVKSAVDQQFLAISRAWVRAGTAGKRRFLDEYAAEIRALMGDGGAS